MIDNFTFKEKYNIDDLINIIELLRMPGGCPWDAEQTHQSIKKNLIEETYEVIEAINKESAPMLREELGDVLMQVIMHSQMEKEAGNFSFSDVVDEVAQKLIIRHPHVFGEVKVDGVDNVLDNWENIKMQTKQIQNTSSAMDSVPKELPALMRAQKVQKKAAGAGFDFSDISQTLEKLESEIAEFKQALECGDESQIFEELGDILFSAVNVARFADIDSEDALTYASDKFIRRYKGVEALALKRKIDIKSSSIETLDSLWEEVKKES